MNPHRHQIEYITDKHSSHLSYLKIVFITIMQIYISSGTYQPKNISE